jgi:hypothetical protein
MWSTFALSRATDDLFGSLKEDAVLHIEFVDHRPAAFRVRLAKYFQKVPFHQLA